MKKTLVLLFFLPLSLCAQDYVDLVKIGYGSTLNNDFDGSPSSTNVTSLEADLTVPIVINDNNAIITGAIFSRNRLQLFPNGLTASLYSTALKLGIASTYNERWSSTIVLLPKLASDYWNPSEDDFYIGGFASLKYHKRENLIYRFGVYGSQEAFGFFTTPFVGWYYLSPSGNFEMDMSLPIAADMNYDLGGVRIGADYIGIGRSFNLTDIDFPDWYVDVSSLEFSAYAQLDLSEESILIRGKVGYSSNDYEVYAQGEKIDLGLSAFTFGDDRTQLNPDLGGGFFLKLEAIYRFHLPSKKEVQETPEN